jgi:hypothetical protein
MARNYRWNLNGRMEGAAADKYLILSYLVGTLEAMGNLVAHAHRYAGYDPTYHLVPTLFFQ